MADVCPLYSLSPREISPSKPTSPGAPLQTLEAYFTRPVHTLVPFPVSNHSFAQADISTERKPRKSVAFEDNTTIVDSDGQVTESAPMNGDKDSAESHAAGMSILATGCVAHNKPVNFGTDAPHLGEDKEVDEVTDMFAGLAKKKKSKKPKAEGEDADDVLSGLKKKKKSKKPKDADDFEAQLAAKVGDNNDEKEAPVEEQIEEGDMMKGTGIWAHDQTKEIPYNMLLNRFFTLLHSQHPDLASSGSKSYKIPPPQCLREGNKKTIFANISEICKRMKRTDEHGMLSFLLQYD